MNIIIYTKKLKVVIIAFLLCLWSCTKDDNHQVDDFENIVAAFNFTTQKHLVGSNIKFTNESTGINNNTTYEWDFGDKTTSTLKNPSHIYSTLGNYVVKLVVKNDFAEEMISKELEISLSNSIPDRLSLLETLDQFDDKLMVCAHRGNHLDAPENSLKSISDAINNGVGMIELDIRQTKDGKLILMHDATIDRTTNGSGNVNDYLLKELDQFNLYKKNGTLTNERIPSLKEALQLARGKIFIDLDVKIESYAKLYKVINQYGMLGQSMFTVNKISDGNTLISSNSKSIIFPIIRSQTDYNNYINANLNIAIMQFNSTALKDKELIESAKNANISIFGNIYINTSTTPESDNYNQVDNFITLKGKIIQTDHPVKIKNYLNTKNLN